MVTERVPNSEWRFFQSPVREDRLSYLLPSGFSFLFIPPAGQINQSVLFHVSSSSVVNRTQRAKLLKRRRNHGFEVPENLILEPGLLYYFILQTPQMLTLTCSGDDSPALLIQGQLCSEEGGENHLFRFEQIFNEDAFVGFAQQEAQNGYGFVFPSSETFHLLGVLLQQKCDTVFSFVDSTPDDLKLNHLYDLQASFNYFLQKDILSAKHQMRRLYLQEVQTYIEQHLSDDLSVEKIAGVHGLHGVYLQRMCKDEHGQGLMSIVRQKRLALAKYLLEYTDASIASVIRLTGMKSRQVFNAAFRQHFSLRPLQLRRQFQAKQGLQLKAEVELEKETELETEQIRGDEEELC